MAIEVIERGKIPETKRAEFECRRCNSKLRAKVSDGVKTDNQRDGAFVTLICPVCHNPNCNVDLKAFK